MNKKRKAGKKKPVKKSSKRKVVNNGTKSLALVPQNKPVERKLSMVDTFVSEQQLSFLMGKTPANHIYERPAKGGGKWTYVTGVYITKVLNYVFGWNWSFQIIDKGREGNLVWVQGRLSILDNDGKVRMIKEQFGRADIKLKKDSKEPIDYGNDLKAAATDALKKCASELGIAGDVYGKNEFKEIGVKDERIINREVKGNIANEVKVEKVEPKSMTTMDRLKLALHRYGATTEDEALELLKQRTGLVWKSFNNISEKAVENAFKILMNN